MPIPQPYAAIEARNQAARAWAKPPFEGVINRCAVVTSIALQIKPSKSAGDVSLGELPGAKERIQRAHRVPPGPGLSPEGADGMFVRAAQLLPRVVERFGPADVEGTSSVVWPQVEGRRGVLYLEDCYQTEGDVSKTQYAQAAMRLFNIGNPFAIAGAANVFTTADHWDLFNGSNTAPPRA